MRRTLRLAVPVVEQRPPRGTYLGTQRINETVRLAPDGESYTAVAISNLFDTNGTLVVGGLRATITATRIDVERIPDQP